MKRHFIINTILLFVVIFYFIYQNVSINQEYTYPLDDAYIHLSMAKNFAYHGVWGITPYEFSSTSSSPMYLLILAFCIKIFGNSYLINLIVNLISMIGIIIILYHIFKNIHSKYKFYALPAILWAAIMYILVLSGMEHILHILFLLIFIFNLNKFYESGSNKYFYYMLLWGFFSTAVRFESLFFFLPICIHLMINKDWKKSIILGLITLSPVIILGLYSISNGSYLLPNSLLLKGRWYNYYVKHLLWQLKANPHIMVLLAILSWIIFRQYSNRVSFRELVNKHYLPIYALVAMLIHNALALFGWLYRYEAYLITISLVAVAPYLGSILSDKNKYYRLINILLIAAFCWYFGARTIESFKFATIAPQNINHQQIQMAKFLHKYYNDDKIAANDIGAISYFTNIRLFDLVGLGSKATVDFYKNPIHGKLSQDAQNKEFKKFILSNINLHNYEAVIIYDNWFVDKLPEQFIKVSDWFISNNKICGSEKVSFYAVDSTKVERLRYSVNDFKKYINHNAEIRVY